MKQEIIAGIEKVLGRGRWELPGYRHDVQTEEMAGFLNTDKDGIKQGIFEYGIDCWQLRGAEEEQDELLEKLGRWLNDYRNPSSGKIGFGALDLLPCDMTNDWVGSGTTEMRKLQERLLEASVRLGVEAAVAHMARWRDGGNATITDRLSVEGITVRGRTSGEEITIRESEREDEEWFSLWITDDIRMRDFSTVIIERTREVGPILYRPPGYLMDFSHTGAAHCLADMVGLAANARVIPTFLWSNYGALESFRQRRNGRTGTGFGRQAGPVGEPRGPRIGEKEVQQAEELFRKAGRGGEREGLNAVKRWSNSLEGSRNWDVMAELRIATELTFVPQKVTRKRGPRMAAAAARLGMGAERQKIQSTMTAFYNAASKLIHGQSDPWADSWGEEEGRLISEAREICRQGILKGIMEGWEHVQWSEH